MLNRIVLLLIFMSFVSCNKDGYKTTESGLKYRIIRNTPGKNAQKDEVVQLNLSYHLPDDSVLYDSRVLGDSFVLKITAPSFSGSIEEGLMLLGEGDSAEFLLPADSVYTKLFKQRVPGFIPSGTILKFRVGVVKVFDEAAFKRRIREESAKAYEQEAKAIEAYLQENKLQIQPVQPGIWFMLLKEGKGKIPVTGDSVEVKYTGRLLSGKIFDSSAKAGRNLRYRTGSGNFLKAWDQAITSMPEGSTARLVLSSANAFGRSTAAPVPPGSPVVFDIELVRIF